jgi:hypothetical protein
VLRSNITQVHPRQAPRLVITYAVTADMADGQPLPPLIEEGIAWHVVRRAGGRTTWRRIFLSTFSRHRLAHGAEGSNKSAARRTPIMDTRKYSGQTFISLADVAGGPLREQIAAVTVGKYDKLNAVFESGDILSLNATNVRILQRSYGIDSDLWIGKEVELFKGEVEYEKKMQAAVLIRPISPPVAAAKKAAAAKKLDDFDDELPSL